MKTKIQLLAIMFVIFSVQSQAISITDYREDLKSILVHLSRIDTTGKKITLAQTDLKSLLQKEYDGTDQLKSASLHLFSQLFTDVWIDHFNKVVEPEFYFGYIAYLLYTRGDLENASYFLRPFSDKDLEVFDEPYVSTLRLILDRRINTSPKKQDRVLSIRQGESFELFGRFESQRKISFVTVNRTEKNGIVYSSIRFGEQQFTSADQHIRFLTVCNDIMDVLIFKTSIMGQKKYLKYSFGNAMLYEKDFDNGFLFTENHCLVDEKDIFYRAPCQCKMRGEDGQQ
jgi:hypothetical protein